MNNIHFYLRYSLRHLWREKQRTTFALFCIAVGVAAIVGLQMLGFFIADALTGSAQAANRGDVAVEPGRYVWFTAEQMAAFEQLTADDLVVNWTFRYYQDGLSLSVERAAGAETSGALGAFLVDPEVYPFYGQVLALDPPDAPLSNLLTTPDSVVISKNLADRRNIAVGDRLRIGDTRALYTVRGIVPTGSAVWLRDPGPLLNGFLYLDYNTSLETLGLERKPAEVFFMTEGETHAAALAKQTAEIALATQAKMRTAADRLAQNEGTAATVGRLTLIVGLLALLIGGLGIANTMQVVVARRRLETAVLKAVGLKGRHVTGLFLSEAALLGLIGSLAGLLLGLGVSRLLLELAMAMPFWSIPVSWQVYPHPLLTGLVAGIVVTVIVGMLPTLAAAQIRPSLVLRPGNDELPGAGRWQSLGAVLILAGVMGLLAGQLLDSLPGGLAGAYGVLIVLAVLTGLLQVVVWTIEKLPSLGWVSLHLAQRGIGRNRGRAASTLLALIVGLFSVSLIVIFANNTISNLEKTTSEAMGGDLQIRVRDEAAREAVLQALEANSDVLSCAEAGIFAVELIAINGDRDAYERRIADYERDQGIPLPPQAQEMLAWDLSTITGRDLRVKAPYFNLSPGMGRNLTPDDAGQPVVLLVNRSTMAPLKLQPGDALTFRLSSNSQITLEIVAVVREDASGFSRDTIIAPLDVLSPLAVPRARLFVANINPRKEWDKVADALSRSLPGDASVTSMASITNLNTLADLLSRTIIELAILPIVIAALALLAAATMIANTVALATMERRREIGVMKAVGVREGQILGQLLLESGIIGLVGGLIGVGLVTLLLILFLMVQGLPVSVNPWHVLGLLSLSVGVTLIATLVAAWPASRRRPLDVLRYE
jgi:ABC-type antimicrobial peptide transport system permease subunit